MCAVLGRSGCSWAPGHNTRMVPSPLELLEPVGTEGRLCDQQRSAAPGAGHCPFLPLQEAGFYSFTSRAPCPLPALSIKHQGDFPGPA